MSPWEITLDSTRGAVHLISRCLEMLMDKLDGQTGDRAQAKVA